ncbi:protein EFFECTOR OF TRANSCRIPTION 2 [Amborella trichopoda]|uniref:protein EFFECTOR OF TRANSCRIPTION 2 n=1 Tax=Amborella trichopoda TaxID=13333 RepID=UPI0005D4058D|nr:protein EFFECTOR OF TRANSCRIPTION 2 [Amborella trichopoda]XP_020528740.1 protein EFFECTOR OF TRANSCRIPTION 2 [Amborella trichopoda]|eukprot:XP_011626787.1 protein EFFECTOR OF TRANSCRIPTION 2 [Amborella trichopoda]
MVFGSETHRIRREEQSRTKLDHLFSKWEILIGPSDWGNYLLGKEGTEKYRIHNLPLSSSCPGIYELGVAPISTGLGRTIRKIDPSAIVVAYIGHADNVRTRLQHYGRSGSHLELVDPFVLPDNGKPSEPVTTTNQCLEKRPGLFREAFSRGFYIVFRWAPMTTKREAGLAESRLLSNFDYAWNKGANGARRPADILAKLDRTHSQSALLACLSRKLGHLKWNGITKKCIGIDINAGKLEDEGSSGTITFEVSDTCEKESRGYERESGGVCRVPEFKKSVEGESGVVCGVALGDGSICSRPPVEGRKRCSEHKGMRVNASKLEEEGSYGTRTFKPNGTYGIASVFESESWGVCRVPEFKNSYERESGVVCGVALGDGSICSRCPVEGRKRCSEHKGMRVNASKLEDEGSYGTIIFKPNGTHCKESRVFERESWGVCRVPEFRNSYERESGVVVGHLSLEILMREKVRLFVEWP